MMTSTLVGEPIVLQLDSVTAGYGKKTVIMDVSFTVPDATLLAVLGNSGAGKTTVLRSVMGLVPARSGTITFDGADITKMAANRRVRSGIGYVARDPQASDQLSARENLKLVADHHGKAGITRMSEALDFFPGLSPQLSRRVGLMSIGQRRQLAIARSLIPGPKLMILDDPTADLSSEPAAEIRAAIASILGRYQMSVLLVEHDLGYALDVASSYLVLAKGKIVRSGKAGSSELANARDAMMV